jgi:hypothetical protein
VSIVSFRKGGLAVRTHTWDRDLGGRDIDELLFDHFCKEFQTRFKIDVRSNAKASFKLRSQCQRLKKVGQEVQQVAGWQCPALLQHASCVHCATLCMLAPTLTAGRAVCCVCVCRCCLPTLRALSTLSA